MKSVGKMTFSKNFLVIDSKNSLYKSRNVWKLPTNKGGDFHAILANSYLGSANFLSNCVDRNLAYKSHAYEI